MTTDDDFVLRGAWTREKGDRMAAGMLRRMTRPEGDEDGDDEMAEGMEEFVQLCRMRFGGG